MPMENTQYKATPRVNLKMVGAPGFEPGTSASRTRRAAVLRYAPTDNESAGNQIARSPKSIREATWEAAFSIGRSLATLTAR